MGGTGREGERRGRGGKEKGRGGYGPPNADSWIRPGFYPDALALGGITGIGGLCWGSGGRAPSGVQGQSPLSGGLEAKPLEDGGLGAVPPAGSRGRAPGHGVWGRSPQKLKAFRCISS